jgi:hypothetical protein
MTSIRVRDKVPAEWLEDDQETLAKVFDELRAAPAACPTW